VECEIVIVIDSTLSPDGAPFTEETIRAAVRGAMPCFEVPDSRFKDPPGVLSLVADNAAARAVVVGAEADLDSVGSLAEVAVRLTVDGQLVAEGRGAAAMADPIRAVTWLANHLAERRLTLEAGSVVLTGALNGAHSLAPDALAVADFDNLGSVEVRFS
jgi:2-keto-4-pentenoate hydratase